METKQEIKFTTSEAKEKNVHLFANGRATPSLSLTRSRYGTLRSLIQMRHAWFTALGRVAALRLCQRGLFGVYTGSVWG